MCGGTLEINNEETVGVCEYCGTKQTLSKTNDEFIINLFNRANNLRLKCEFDKATQIYEKIVEQDATEAEAYWGIVLCKYGIEYVEDSKTFERIPTCHRTLYEAVTSDVDYIAAVKHADLAQRMLYEKEAKAIENVQKDILNIVKNEKPFDVFICYKETDETGKRTVDSVIANDIYHELTEEGFKVFYSAITLEEKLGQEYEPYIFAALNSAKVMLVIGTKPEYFEAVWVKNEWGRFLKLMKQDRSKLLIPCYKDMDAYELPEDFAHLQAQDMGKIGFINDVIRGIKKVLLDEDAEQDEKETVVVNALGASEEPLLKRAFMFLEDGEFERADEFCEQVLNLNPENARAYLGKLMAELRVRKQEHLSRCDKSFENKNNYQKVLRFADERLIGELKEYVAQINQRNKDTEIKETYARAKASMTADTIPNLYDSIDLYNQVIDFRDSKEMIAVCEKRIVEIQEEIEEKRKNDTYAEALSAMESSHASEVERAISLFESIIEWKDSEEKISACKNKIEKLEIEAKCRAKRGRIAGIVFMTMIVGAITLGILFGKIIIPNSKYSRAVELMEKGEFKESIVVFTELDGYKDSEKQIELCEIAVHEQIKDKIKEFSKYENNIVAGTDHTVGLKTDGTVVATGNNDYGECDVLGWTDIVAVAVGYNHTVGLKSDGTVTAVGGKYDGQCNVSGWTDIVAVTTGSEFGEYTIGLKSDGTLVATGDNSYGQCNVLGWSNIVGISAERTYIVGLKSDGTVVATGDNSYGQCNVSGWKDIQAISVANNRTVGLRKDGTVVATGNNEDGQCNVGEWKDIVSISLDLHHTVGLKSDGTVVAVGTDGEGRCDVTEWEDIVSVVAGGSWTIGIKADGTVIATGRNGHGQCNVKGWKEVVAIATGDDNTFGLKLDGTVVATGNNKNGQCDVDDWNLFE